MPSIRTFLLGMLLFSPAGAEPVPASPSATAASNKPDIAIEGSLNEVLIGGGTGLAARTVTFRHRQLVMYPDWAVGGTRKGECKIQVMYLLTNMGDAPTETAFKVRLSNNGKKVGEDRIEVLAPRERRRVITHGLFTSGQHEFAILIDPDNQIQESNEGNNLQKFSYTLNGKCKATHKPQQAAVTAGDGAATQQK